MSDIDIKASTQAALNTSRNVDVRDQRASDKSQDVQPAETRTDTVSLTDTAAQLSSLQQTVSDSSAVDKERVESLRAAISEGSYNVDATELAHNMINFEQQLAD